MLLLVGQLLIRGMADVSPSKNFQMSFTVLCHASESIESWKCSAPFNMKMYVYCRIWWVIKIIENLCCILLLATTKWMCVGLHMSLIVCLTLDLSKIFWSSVDQDLNPGPKDKSMTLMLVSWDQDLHQLVLTALETWDFDLKVLILFTAALGYEHWCWY